MAASTRRASALSALVVLTAATAAFAQPIRRVPAEFEPQEAIWLQWPGRFEKTYEPAYARISNVVAQHQALHILCDTNAIRNQARDAISSAGGDPDHPNIVWQTIPNENAWMRDNGPLYVVQDGQMRIQDWAFDRDPSYTYETEGIYSVTLKARSASGGGTRVRTDYITVPEPGSLLQLMAGCLGLFALCGHRQGHPRSSAERTEPTPGSAMAMWRRRQGG